MNVGRFHIDSWENELCRGRDERWQPNCQFDSAFLQNALHAVVSKWVRFFHSFGTGPASLDVGQGSEFATKLVLFRFRPENLPSEIGGTMHDAYTDFNDWIKKHAHKEGASGDVRGLDLLAEAAETLAAPRSHGETDGKPPASQRAPSAMSTANGNLSTDSQNAPVMAAYWRQRECLRWSSRMRLTLTLSSTSNHPILK